MGITWGRNKKGNPSGTWRPRRAPGFIALVPRGALSCSMRIRPGRTARQAIRTEWAKPMSWLRFSRPRPWRACCSTSPNGGRTPGTNQNRSAQGGSGFVGLEVKKRGRKEPEKAGRVGGPDWWDWRGSGMVGRDIGEHIKALVPDFAEEFRAPALPIKDHGNPALACQAPNLGQDLAAQHRQQIVIRGSGDDKQRLGVLLVHPDIGGGRLAQATPSDPRFRQLVCGSVIGPDVAVDVEQLLARI